LKKGYVCLVLHAHLPYIRHPEYEAFMEEYWLYEGMIETYIPLLNTFNNLLDKNIDYKITMSISPSLCEMFSDELLQKRFEKKLNDLIELSYKEIDRTLNTDYNKTALMYNKRLLLCRQIYNQYDKNLINGFKYFRNRNYIEIITCSATHAFMPLIYNKNILNAQIEIAVNNYYKYFKKKPLGIWNSECGYYPGIEEILKKHGIKYFFVDTHGILYADKKPKYGIFAPISCNNGVYVFGRDIDSGKQVWSATEGYPGNPVYRDFYRDIGFDLPLDYIAKYLHSPYGIRMMTGFKYHKITGNNVDKLPYNLDEALQKVEEHAKDFVSNRELQVKNLFNLIDKNPIIVSPYDAELFGHWWFEGPQFIEKIAEYIDESEILSMITPSEYLNIYPEAQIATPSISSWGYKGYMDVWLNQTNDWIYRHLHEASNRVIELSNKYFNEEDDMIKRVLNQMARELLVAQTSCWAFIISTGTTVEYAKKTLKDHLRRFNYFYEMIKKSEIDENFLKICETRTNIFDELDYRFFSDAHCYE